MASPSMLDLQRPLFPHKLTVSNTPFQVVMGQELTYRVPVFKQVRERPASDIGPLAQLTSPCSDRLIVAPALRL